MSEPLRYNPACGVPLADWLFENGVEFPCGGAGTCGSCRVRIVEGGLPADVETREILGAAAVDAGWRLACRCAAPAPVTVEVAQWSVAVLSDERAVPFEPGAGFAAAVDLGTTTVVAQVMDRASGEVLGVRPALNAQARHGADVMSRIQFELRNPGELTALVREQLGALVAEAAAGRPLGEVLISGNTVMHHLFCGLPVEPLASVPFRSPSLGARRFRAAELGWTLAGDPAVEFLPCAGGFVGSDVVAGLLDAGFLDAQEPVALLDLGTNGEISVTDGRRVLAASTAAGPAFEAGRLRYGMRAGDGAIDRVEARDGTLIAHVLGGGVARGLCGSGLVDAVAAALDLGLLLPSGRLAGGRRELPLAGAVSLTQADIRELQLAKGAVAAGLRILSRLLGAAPERILLAGAFGNYVRARSARRIGLLPPAAPEPEALGNTALRGTRRLALSPAHRVHALQTLLARTQHVELASDPEFQDTYVECMAFPEEW